MLTRRRLLSIGAAGLAAGPAFLAGRAAAQGRPLTFCSWGGALSELEKTALLDPFAKAKGIEIAHASPTNYAKIKSMVEAGAPEWDIVDVGGRFVTQGKDLLEPLDMSLIPNAKALDPGWVTPKGIFTSTGATVIAWNTNAFPADKGPKSWKDFWDVKAFPGARGLYKQFYYNYEAALLAAGVARKDVFPVTDDKIKLAFDKLREIKPHVKVWWNAGAQPPQLLSSGELAMSSAWSGRILAGIKEKAPIAMTYEDGIAWGNAWVVLKGTPHLKACMEAINYAISEEAQSRLLDAGTYGPALGAASAKASEAQRKVLVTAPENAKNMLILDEEQAAAYSAKYEADWNRFQLGG
ncbi:polyamine ABC transporter substrate-binding protein [Prosthecomicrobium hirschii]|uniref:Polyamine ABC transporter substrate-binding protein n=1 Tax=Prosthecodimorpha hirschii TaxID=665126 RepID=A0A0P6VNS9_9HYPH|nr:ABC transporter substrate-binding protein [Prosthecomicrobium hirschii]KPL52013.1 polyamine ABC transporter substrate-binding protein [Prosthecomicrobium hirschii]